MCVFIAQSCLTLFDLMGCSLPGFSVHRLLQTRLLKSIDTDFSRRSSWPKGRTWVSCIAGRFSLSHQGSQSVSGKMFTWNSGNPFRSLFFFFFLRYSNSLGENWSFNACQHYNSISVKKKKNKKPSPLYLPVFNIYLKLGGKKLVFEGVQDTFS